MNCRWFKICNVEGIIDVNEISEFNVIKNIDIIKSINTNNLNINYTHEDGLNTDLIDILSVSIKLSQVIKNKVSNNKTTIYFFNFIYNLSVSISDNNSKFNQMNIKDIYSFSFTYKDVEVSDLDIYPINLELKNLDNKIYLIINLLLADKSNELILENTIEVNDQIVENISNKDYSYININQEFI